MAPQSAHAAASFVDRGRYAVAGVGQAWGSGIPAGFDLVEGTPLLDGSRTAGLAVLLPTSTSIQFDGYIDHWLGAQVGTQSAGLFIVDSPTVVTLTGLATVNEQTTTPLALDFRIGLTPVPNQLVRIFDTTGVYVVSERILVAPGSYDFFIGAFGADVGNSVDFSLLLTIPEPATGVLLGLGLVGMAATNQSTQCRHKISRPSGRRSTHRSSQSPISCPKSA